ncbi:hypothetical protein D299_gp196 [Escherichia phage HX01]|nr:hypothetical protein D299_gp196 [Escherichia phage HX01]
MTYQNPKLLIFVVIISVNQFIVLNW